MCVCALTMLPGVPAAQLQIQTVHQQGIVDAMRIRFLHGCARLLQFRVKINAQLAHASTVRPNCVRAVARLRVDTRGVSGDGAVQQCAK